MTNQLLFGVNYFNQVFQRCQSQFRHDALGLDLSPDALIHGQPILGAPNIAISGFEQVGSTPPEGRNDITGMLSDIVSYNVGKHQFRFGGEFRQGHVDEFYFRHSLGSFTFDGTQGPWAGSCAATDAVCLANDFAGRLSGRRCFILLHRCGQCRAKSRCQWLSTSSPRMPWQITRRLNVNWGLRWDYFGPLHNGTKDLAVFVPGKGLVIQGNGIESIFPPDKNNFAPRFGFAYQPTNREDLVVRGGVGVFYDQINMNPFLDFRPPNGGADGLEGNPAGP